MARTYMTSSYIGDEVRRSVSEDTEWKRARGHKAVSRKKNHGQIRRKVRVISSSNPDQPFRKRVTEGVLMSSSNVLHNIVQDISSGRISIHENEKEPTPSTDKVGKNNEISCLKPTHQVPKQSKNYSAATIVSNQKIIKNWSPGESDREGPELFSPSVGSKSVKTLSSNSQEARSLESKHQMKPHTDHKEGKLKDGNCKLKTPVKTSSCHKELKDSKNVHKVKSSTKPEEKRMKSVDVNHDNLKSKTKTKIDSDLKCSSDLAKEKPKHRVSSDKKKYKCDTCSEKFTHENEYNSHTATHIFGGDIEEIKSICSASKPPESKPVIHEKVQKKLVKVPRIRFTCPRCRRVFSDKSILRDHMMVHLPGTPQVCKDCGRSFMSEKSLEEHRKVHKVIEKLKIGRKRDLCPQILGRKRRYKISVQPQNPDYLKNHEVKREKTQSEEFPCKECGRKLAVLTYLKHHMLIHTAGKKHVCIICGKAFRLKRFLREHIVCHGYGTHNHICELCGETFKTRSAMATHRKIHKSSKRKMASEPKMEKSNESQSDEQLSLPNEQPEGSKQPESSNEEDSETHKLANEKIDQNEEKTEKIVIKDGLISIKAVSHIGESPEHRENMQEHKICQEKREQVIIENGQISVRPENSQPKRKRSNTNNNPVEKKRGVSKSEGEISDKMIPHIEEKIELPPTKSSDAIVSEPQADTNSETNDEATLESSEALNPNVEPSIAQYPKSNEDKPKHQEDGDFSSVIPSKDTESDHDDDPNDQNYLPSDLDANENQDPTEKKPRKCKRGRAVEDFPCPECPKIYCHSRSLQRHIKEVHRGEKVRRRRSKRRLL